MKRIRSGNKGVALVSSLFFLIIVTVLASGAIMLSTVQMKVASSAARWEAHLAASDGGVSYVYPLVQYIHFDSKVPQVYCDNGTLSDPCVGIGATHALVSELSSSLDYHDLASMPTGTRQRDLFLAAASPSTISGIDIGIDIDGIGSSVVGGGGSEASWAYHGSAYGSSRMRGYRVSTRAATKNARGCTDQVIWLRAVL